MKSLKLRFLSFLLMLGLAMLWSGLVIAQSDSSKKSDEPFLDLTSKTGLGEMPVEGSKKETVVVRQFFKAYHNETKNSEWPGSLGGAAKGFQFNGEPAKIIEGPSRVLGEDKQVPLMFLFAIDVSGSMGGKNYEQRMQSLATALTNFFEKNENPNLFVQLYPFGHEVPFDVTLSGHPQNISLWANKFLPMDQAGKAALLQGVRDIDLFVREGSGAVHTALFGAYMRGMDRLLEDNGRDELNGAKKILILLSDGKNDARADYEQYLHDLDVAQVVREMERQKTEGNGISTYSLGFGVNDEALGDLEALSQPEQNKLKTVSTGSDAARSLTDFYEGVFETEGNSWYVDINTGMTRSEMSKKASDISHGQYIRYNDQMLLNPSPQVKLASKSIGFSLIGIALFLSISGTVWFYTRPQNSEHFADVGEEPGLGEEEEEVLQADNNSMGVRDKIIRMREERENEN